MMECRDLGLISYHEAWQIQERLRDERVKGVIPDTILLLEHTPVFTLGKRDCPQDIVSTPETIASDGIEIIKTNRGGKVTYHGPGQLVCYFICSINTISSPLGGEACPERSRRGRGEGGRGIKRFVYLIEEVCLGILSDYGVKGTRDPEHPGIWIGKDKIAAIGLHVSKGITQHGFALNVSPNLDHYRHIVPCGIQDRGVTSLEAILGKTISISEVKDKTLPHIKKTFRHKVKVDSRGC